MHLTTEHVFSAQDALAVHAMTNDVAAALRTAGLDNDVDDLYAIAEAAFGDGSDGYDPRVLSGVLTLGILIGKREYEKESV